MLAYDLSLFREISRLKSVKDQAIHVTVMGVDLTGLAVKETEQIVHIVDKDEVLML